MSVAAWLRQLGLERYEQAFAAHDVDAQTLPLLTESDLADVGVKSVGHRRKLIEAISALKNSALPGPAAASARLDAEYRQLSVLYCDLVGSTALSERLDPEALRDVIRAFHDAGTRVVAGYDGHVANFIGDCLLAYFGWPRAHEDDAERAVRAGLGLVDAVDELRTPSGGALAVRVSIASGPVVVGDLLREGPAQEQSAVGAAPLVTAQLQTLVPPGGVVVDELTAQLLASSFALQPLGRHALQGSVEPVAAYTVVAEQLADSRFDARQGRALAPMVGREQELSLLLERWSQAQGGEGQAVLLVGEAGIGKSRLTRALLDACAAQPHRTVRWQCSPHHTGTPLWPVAQRLGRLAGLGPDEPIEQALDKLEAMTGQNGQAAALYAALLGIDATQRYGSLEMTPQVLRERTLELLVEQLLEMAEQSVLLLVVEDAHWIDPTTRELVDRCLERVDRARMLILITSRPDHQPRLGAHPSVTRLSLNRLSRASVQAIVARLGGGGLQAQTLATIVAQTDGVPLFIEELTKAVLETGEAAIPASLHGSLMARLDRIPQVKETAQIAACIGREFDRALVQAVAEQPGTVAAALDELVAAELVFRRGDKTNPRFVFKHALVQEAAYESLLRSKRQQLHARILAFLEAERLDAAPEVLAHHAIRAALVDKAIAYWNQAGSAALAKSAYAEAADCLNQAIALIHEHADGTHREAEELELQLRLGQAHVALQGFGAQVSKKAFMRASELLALVPAPPSTQLRARYGLWSWHITRADLPIALQLAAEALAAAQAGGTHEMLLQAHRMVAGSHLFLGHLAETRSHFERAMALVDSARRGELIAQFGLDPGVATLCYAAWTSCLQGDAEQSTELQQRARRLGSTVPQVTARAQMHLVCGMGAACAGDTATVASEADALAALAATHRLSMYGQYADILRGWALTAAAEEDVRAFGRNLDQLVASGSSIWIPFFRARYASALMACGHRAEALSTIAHALAECERSAQGWCLAELWRVRGTLQLQGPQPERAEAVRSFERALAIARGQGARLWELRAAASLEGAR
ncbi:MAG TPA: AAA family ATPase [Burkholderiaceae bacterium]|nr:AAA family ATPase [Burkholderiaceae bacterium]